VSHAKIAKHSLAQPRGWLRTSLLERCPCHRLSARNQSRIRLFPLVARPAARYPNTFNSRPISDSPLKHEYFLFGDQEDRCAAGRNCHCIPERLLASVRCASLQSLHGGEWISAMRWKGGVPCGDPTILLATIFVLPPSFSTAMGTCSSLYTRSKDSMSLGQRIDHDQLNVTHFTLLEVKCLYP
jgi:hypothetical protein